MSPESPNGKAHAPRLEDLRSEWEALIREVMARALTAEFTEAMARMETIPRENDVFLREIDALKSDRLIIYLAEQDEEPEFTCVTKLVPVCPFGPKAIITALANLFSIGAYVRGVKVDVLVLNEAGIGRGFRTLNLTEHDVHYYPVNINIVIPN